jgi:hypothetical protein
MPKLDGKGPKGEGSQTGRKLGNCSSKTEKEKLHELGKGMGNHHKSVGGKGKGKRLKSGLK